MNTSIPSRLSDAELEAELKRVATLNLVAHLAELDARRLYLGAGFSSLFMYCATVLRLSEHEAYNRIEAARTARRYPIILDMLGEGAVNLTTVRLLAPHLSNDNHEELLGVASGRSKREVEELLARQFPRPEVPSSIRKLPVPAPTRVPARPPAADTSRAEEADEPRSVGASLPAAAALLPPVFAPPAQHRPALTPLADDRYVIRFTATAGTREKLRLAQDLLRHAIPTGDLGEIFDRALTALVEKLAREKLAATERPRASRVTKISSRHIPAEVRRAVWLRDGGRCGFVGKGGRRCAERSFLEFHHVQPYAVGGQATVDNIALRCRAHNAYEADLFYGSRKPRRNELVPERARLPHETAAMPVPT
ncbi:MAG: hypothetical protein DMF79_07915 [Acidobacteria bacterium]|nr:MAG: hypothetical protein DMF79_07915 [Acidobacteriota bacterium]